MPLSRKAKEAKKHLSTPLETSKEVFKAEDYLSTGLTLANLALTGHTLRGLIRGKIYRIAGRSSSGKTFVCRTSLAEAARDSTFDDYALIYDDIEGGALMETQRFFGKNLARRLQAPAYKGREPTYSVSLVDFYRKIKERLKRGEPFIWIVDSVDSLQAEVTTKMGDGKAKINSQNLRDLVDGLTQTKSILIFVSQARADLRNMFGGDTTSGGSALEYYSSAELWLRKAKTLKRPYRGGEFPVGITIRMWIKKNRISGIDRVLYFPFHPDYGIDNIGANVDFLTRFKRWPKNKGVISAPEIDFEGKRDRLITHIEEEGKQREVEVVTGKEWHRIESALLIKRKPRYE